MALISAMRSIPCSAACIALVVLAAGCASLPPLEARVESRTLADTASTPLGSAIGPLAAVCA